MTAIHRWVQLNVGGKSFHTTADTILAKPSLLKKWLDDGFAQFPRDSSGVPFIDRDGDNFRLILNYLRGYTVDGCPERLMFLLEDARFYGVDELVQFLSGNTALSKRFLPGPGVSNDGMSFSSSLVTARCGPVLSSGSHKVMFHVEKVNDALVFAVVNEQCDLSNRELVGKRDTVCYSLTGEMTLNVGGRISVTPGSRIRDAEYVSIGVEFLENSASITFLKGVDVVHTVEVTTQPLQIAVSTFGSGVVSVVESKSVDRGAA